MCAKYVYQYKTLMKNGKVDTDRDGIVKETEYINESPEWWINLIKKAEKIIRHRYALCIVYQGYEYSLRINNIKLTEHDDLKLWIERHWLGHGQIKLF